MLQMDWLTNHMDKSDQMAEWLHREFSYEFAQQSLASWQQEFAAGQHDGRWKCLIAMEHDQLLGGASLASHDLPDRPELGPWLACVHHPRGSTQRACGAVDRRHLQPCARGWNHHLVPAHPQPT